MTAAPTVRVDMLTVLADAAEANAWDWHSRGWAPEAQQQWGFALQLRDAIERANTPTD